MSVTTTPQHSAEALIKGVNGQLQFDGVYVTIHRKGFMARTSVGKGEKRIPLNAISSVQWKPPGAVMNGFIQFETPGVGGTRSRAGHQTSDASHDENSVLFTRKQQPAFEQLRQAVEQAIADRHNPQPQAVAPALIADELVKLAQLRNQGILSTAEFEQQKARLLGG